MKNHPKRKTHGIAAAINIEPLHHDISPTSRGTIINVLLAAIARIRLLDGLVNLWTKLFGDSMSLQQLAEVSLDCFLHSEDDFTRLWTLANWDRTSSAPIGGPSTVHFPRQAYVAVAPHQLRFGGASIWNSLSPGPGRIFLLSSTSALQQGTSALTADS